MPDFVHLHLHSQYSLLDGAVRIDDLLTRVKELGMNAVAITDHGNMFGIADFFQKAVESKIKPILGCEAYVSLGDRRDRTERKNRHLILLARNQEGYKNLKYLISMAYLEGFYYRPRIDKELLKKYSKGLIGCSACLGGEVAMSFRYGGYEKAKKAAASLNSLFETGRFFLEIQNNGYPQQPAYNDALRKIGQELSIPLMATNDVHYLYSDDADAHKALMCIPKKITIDDPKASSHYTDELYLRSADEMAAALPDFKDALENTVKIADMCEEINPFGKLDLPNFATPDNEPLDDYLIKISHKHLNERFLELEEQKINVNKTSYRNRLDDELKVICQMGYEGYFLIVHDFIAYSKKQNIPVGPGRGSGAGSLVAYALKITNIDPIPLNLLFERFLNPERVSMPDFDIDFCTNRRDEVIAYVIEKYGKNNVGQIATFHQLKSRSVVRDVGRVLGMEYRDVDKIAKMVPGGPQATSLKETMESEKEIVSIRKKDYMADKLLTLAARLENLNRHAGMHAAGIVIGNKPLWEYVPVFTSTDKNQTARLASQFDMNFVETCGLVKFDFLGLKTLTIIDLTLKLVNKRRSESSKVIIEHIPMDDKKVFDLISSGNTWGVFQLESDGFQDLLKKLKPDCFEDVIAAVALYRPGPISGGMVDIFIDRKHGREDITYFHPKLEKFLKETYGVFVYQEQVMQAARALANYSLGSADIMRRAMGKKKPAEMAKQKQKFISGCVENGIQAGKASGIFEKIEKFAEYGFNKSHSAAYAMISYQTAWLKTYFPVEFLAALLTTEMEKTDKVVRYIRLGNEMGIKVHPPDVNKSEIDFSVIYPKDKKSIAQIKYALGAVKGVGKEALKSIIETRKSEEFTDIYDFAGKVDLAKVNKGVIESLIKSGAFDLLKGHANTNRGQIFQAMELALERGRISQRDKASGQINMFEMLESGTKNSKETEAPSLRFDQHSNWSEAELLNNERESIGFYISGHPMTRYKDEAKRLTDTDTLSVKQKAGGSNITIAGMVMEYTEKTSRGGNRYATFMIEDLKGRTDAVVYAKSLPDSVAALTGNEPVIVTGRLKREDSKDDSSLCIICLSAQNIQDARHKKTTKIFVYADADAFPLKEMQNIKKVMEKHPGRCDSFIVGTVKNNFCVTIGLPEQLRVAPSDKLLDALKEIKGIERVAFM